MKKPRIIMVILCLCICQVYGCSGGTGGSSEGADTGSIRFSIMMPSAGTSAAPFLAAAMDCGTYGIASVTVEVYDENGVFLTQGGPWACSRHEGLVQGIKAGFNRSVRVLLLDNNQTVIYRGVKSGLTVRAGQTTDTGSIEIRAEELYEPPEAVADVMTVNPGGSMVILDSGDTSLLSNDGGDTLQISTQPVSGPSHGTLILYTDGTFRYTHDGSATTSDSFTYAIVDRRGVSDTAAVSISIYNPIPFNHPPILEKGMVGPDTGAETTTFTFSVHYRDDDGDLPTVRALYIDGLRQAMTPPSDQAAANGTYTFRASLSPGNHTYYFALADGRGGSARLPYEGTYAGPTVVAAGNHTPALNEGGVSPTIGNSATTFTYSVRYFDEDGDIPAAQSVYIDGTPHTMQLLSGTAAHGIYGYDSALSPGTHTYYFTFTDPKGGSARLPFESVYSHTTTVERGYFVAPPPLGNDGNDGSAAHPFATIGHAVAVAQGTQTKPATIYIAAGTYRESLALDAWESLQGGWRGGFTQRWNFMLQGVDPSPEYETVIDGGGSNRCLSISGKSGVTVDGITLAHGKSLPDTPGGGGMYIEACAPVITHCRLMYNITAGCGGGMYIAGGSPTIAACHLYGNRASGAENRMGGGIYNYKSNPVISRCTFEANSAGCSLAAGGAVYNHASPALILGCTFKGNTTNGDNSLGAALYNANCNPTIANCVFWKNTATGKKLSAGGAIYNEAANPAITNCTFFGNNASACAALSRGGGIYNAAAAKPVIVNTILWGDFAGEGNELYNEDGVVCTMDYTDIDQAPYGDDTLHHTMREAPLFVDPEKGDLHLLGGSPCIDRGTNAASALPETDIDGDPRLIHAVVDMGADERP